MRATFSFFDRTVAAMLIVEMMSTGRFAVFLRPCQAWVSSVSKGSTGRSRSITTTIRHFAPLITKDNRFGSYTPLKMSSTSTPVVPTNKMINLHTIPVEELEVILESWGQPKYRAQQIWNWVRVQGVTSIDEMKNIPKGLKTLLKEHATMGSLQLDCELISKDGTIKRAYRLSDGQLIESVLMPYEDGRYTACISSQAGCAQGCVFCATGQMGFSRQLTPDEILEQVSRFASELAAKDKVERKEDANTAKSTKNPTTSSKNGRSTRLSNIVFMGSKF